MKKRIGLLLSASFLFATGVYAQQPASTGTPPPSQRRAFFGELHLHTAMSFDAWTFGTKIMPDQAYKFARGETVMVPAGQIAMEQGKKVNKMVPAKRAWALDFTAVTDHSEAMGVFNQLDDPNNPVSQTDIGKKIEADPSKAFYLIAARKPGDPPGPDMHAPQAMRNAWDVEIKAANDNYEPGKFTTFIAYEWSSMNQAKYNLHRNVIFNADTAPLPFTSQQSDRPEDLWTYLESVRKRGIDVIAIPHNGNVSGGLMYDWNNSDGKPIDEAYAERRALNEPLTEIVQNKGQSDTTPQLSPDDDFANFEIFDHLLTWPGIKSPGPGGYIRDAYGRGLVIQANAGANPYKYGVVGGSDMHNGLEVSSENAFASGPWGIDPKTMLPPRDAAKKDLDITKTPALLDMDAVLNKAPPTPEQPLIFRPSGLTGVWAEENNRNSIFAALKRKETWATSGTRIRLRMFGGWGFDPAMMSSGGWVETAYSTGVPMGADMPAKPTGSNAPRFALWAVKDPDGANLDRIQIIKVWLDGSGYKQKVFDAALSNGRVVDAKTGKTPAIRNTVNLKTGAYANSVGAVELKTVWQDPEFDASKAAVYYARVLEIPTPRWSTLLAIKEKLPIPTKVPSTIQERGWSSPIWYTPAKAS